MAATTRRSILFQNMGHRPDIGFLLAGLGLAHGQNMLLCHILVHHPHDLLAVRAFHCDHIVRRAQKRHRRALPVVEHPRGQHRQIRRQRIGHLLCGLLRAHVLGHADLQHFIFARPAHRHRRTEAHQRVRVEPLRPCDGQLRPVERALHEPLQIQMRNIAQPFRFSEFQPYLHFSQAPSYRFIPHPVQP